MMKKMKAPSELKELNKTAGSMIVGGIGMGVGSQLVGEVGGASAPHVQTAIGRVSRAYPMMGSMAGMGAVMGTLKKLKKKMW